MTLTTGNRRVGVVVTPDVNIAARPTTTAIGVLAALASLAATGCGDDEAAQPTGPTTPATSDPTPSSGEIVHPTDPDTAIVRIAIGQPYPGSIPNVVIGGDGTFEHDAYALELDNTEDDEDRQRLADAVDELNDVEALVGEDRLVAVAPDLPGDGC